MTPSSFFKVTALSVCAGLFVAGCQAKDAEITPENAEARIAKAMEKAAATTGPGHPSLWSLKDEDTTVYLFGTIHLLPQELNWQTETFASAFSAADTLYLEVDSDSLEAQQKMQQELMSKAALQGEETLSSLLSEEDLAVVKGAAEHVGLPFEQLEKTQPWFTGLQLTMVQILKAGYNPTAGVETVLVEQAKKSGKKTGSFETIEEQIDLLAGGERGEQIEALVFTAHTIDTAPGMIGTLVSEWADGDIKGLGSLMGEPSMFGSQEAYEKIIVDRNKNWVPKIEALLDEPGTKFVAVGAGHLAGPDSVIDMLRKKGRTVSIVK